MGDTVTNERMFEVLKTMQGDLSLLKIGRRDMKAELSAMPGHVLAIRTDLGNTCSTIVGPGLRVEHIEGRLGLTTEPAQ